MKSLLCIVATWAAVVMSVAAAPSQAPAAAADCFSLAYGMMECMGFLTVGATETTPQGSCCSGLKTLVEVNADCMCYAITAAANVGLDLDMSKAKTLPSHCGVAAPSLTTCHATDPPAKSVPRLPPTSAIELPAAIFGRTTAPAPAPSSSRSVVPAIVLNFIFIIFFVLYILY